MPFRVPPELPPNEEPTLDALLGEPIVRLVLARDRVAEDHIRQLVDAVLRRRSLGGREHGRFVARFSGAALPGPTNRPADEGGSEPLGRAGTWKDRPPRRKLGR